MDDKKQIQSKRPRVWQFFKKAGRLAKQAIKSDLGKIIISKDVEHLPSLCSKGASIIKNKNLKAQFKRRTQSGKQWRSKTGIQIFLNGVEIFNFISSVHVHNKFCNHCEGKKNQKISRWVYSMVTFGKQSLSVKKGKTLLAMQGRKI